jgi:alpha-glucoside transport system substrate-binding protein
MPMDRRRALAVLSGLAAAGLTGCGGETPLRIAVVWSDWELSRFHEILAAYPHPFVVYSAGDNIAALLRNPVAQAATPDVAIVPRLGLMEDPDISARLRSVPCPDPSLNFPDWPRLMDCAADNSTKAVWFKVTHKSLVWYRRGVMPAPPADWEAWVGLCRERAKEHPPLAIGAADGWVLTDWFENVLLGIDPELYRKLHLNPPGGWSHASVRETLLRLATLWSIPGLVPGGGRQALTTQFQDSILDVFRYGRADMLAAPDFAWPVIDRYGSGSEALSFRFPGPPGTPNPPVLVGGDAVVALESGGVRGTAFVKWLTDRGQARERLKGWSTKGGFLSLNENVLYPNRAMGDLARELHGDVAFDLSDRLTGGLAGGDGQGLWRVLTELFATVTAEGRRPDLDLAVNTAMKMLTALSETGRSS